MKRLLFVLLILVVLVVAPACAWTELASWTEPPSGTGTLDISSIQATNTGAGNFVNATRIDLEGNFRYTASVSGSVTTYLCDQVTNTQKGEGTFYWQFSGTGLNQPGTIRLEYELTDSSYSNNALNLKTGSCAGDLLWNYVSIVGIARTSGTEGLYHFVYNNYGGNYTVYSGSAITTPVASFSCTPTSQFPDEAVVCTDTSTGGGLDWYWTVTAEALGVEGFTTGTSQNFTWYSHYPGLYSVNLRANNSAGSDWENKTNYVSISENATPNNCNIPPLAGLVRSWAQCVDSQTSGAIAGCDLSLYDLEGGAWSNVTDRFDGTWCIDTYPAHHFNAYGSADGYTPDPTYRLNLPVSSSIVYELIMHPGYVPPAAEGKVWVYVIVNDADTGAAIPDAVVRLDASGQTSKSDTTDSVGSMHIQWVNATQTTATASKSGYGTVSKVFTTSDFGPDTVRIEIHRSTVTPTATATTGPGGTVPTTANPWQNPDGSFKDGYSQYQGQAIMNLLAVHGYNLVLLCIFVTMMALLGFKFGK